MEDLDEPSALFKTAGRIKNLARDWDAALTPAGEGLCNMYAHVLQSFYDFAPNIQEEIIRNKFLKLIEEHESMPAKLIRIFKTAKK